MIELDWIRHINGDWGAIHDCSEGVFYGSIHLLQKSDGDHYTWMIHKESDHGILYCKSGHNLTLDAAKLNAQNLMESEIGLVRTPIPDVLLVMDGEKIVEIRTRLPDVSIGFGTHPGTHHSFVAWCRS